MNSRALPRIILSRYELFAGFRYTRAKRRNRFISFISAISMGGVALGVATLITVMSVMNGFEQELRDHLLGMAAHATISGASGGLADWDSIAAAAEQNPQVVAAAPYVSGEAMLRGGSGLSGVSVQGIDPDRATKVSDIRQYMKEGRLDDLKGGGFKVLLGSELAKALGIKVGDKVDLMIPQAMVTPAGIVPRYRRFTVAGIYEVGLYEFDRHLVLIHLQDAQALYLLGHNVTGVSLKLHDMFQAPTVVRQIAQTLPQLVYISDWTRQHVNYFKAVASEKQVMFLILSLLVGIAVFNIISTLVMVVEEKQADIAILRTLGASPRSIMVIFTVQGAVISFIGTAVGVVLGVTLALHANSLVSILEVITGRRFIDPAVYNISDLPTRIEAADVIRISVMALGLGLLSTLYPAWRAARVNPAEALRYE